MSLLVRIRKAGGEVRLTEDGAPLVRKCPKGLLEYCREHKAELLEEIEAEKAWRFRGASREELIAGCGLICAKDLDPHMDEEAVRTARRLLMEFQAALLLGTGMADAWWKESGDELLYRLHAVTVGCEGQELVRLVREVLGGRTAEERDRQEKFFGSVAA